MTPLCGQNISKNLIRILNLPEHTVGFELKARVNEVVTLTAEYHPKMHDGGRALFTELREYQLIEKPESEDIKSPYLGTHHKKQINVNVNKVAKEIPLEIQLKTTGVFYLKIRLFLFYYLAKILSFICPLNIKINKSIDE